MASPVVVRVQGLSYSYTPDTPGKEVLKDVTLDITRAARVILIGENGAGKSTLLNLIAGKMMTPRNMITVMGQDAFRCTKLQNVVSLISAEWSAAVGAMHTVTYRELEAAVLSTVETSMVELVRARANRLKALLGVEDAWQIGATSEGQRRRAQLVLKLMLPRGVVMLDEATTDLDIIARQNLLQFLFEESVKRSVTVIYCTHIFDGMEGWASQAVHIGQRTILRVEDCTNNPELSGHGVGGMYEVVKRWMQDTSSAAAMLSKRYTASGATPMQIAVSEDGLQTLACDVKGLRWGYNARVLALRGALCQIPAGSRCLVTGGNGAGKSTMLSIIAGHHKVDPDSVAVFGLRAFEDFRKLGQNAVKLLSQEWRQTLRCVGVGGNLTFDNLIQSLLGSLSEDGPLRSEVAARLEHLQTVMQVDPTWACNQVSDGQLRRMQLVMKLAVPCKMVLLDEASVDLDILGRDALLQFLREESEGRGVTVLYCTHILDGLDGWASHHVHLYKGKVSLERRMTGAPDEPMPVEMEESKNVHAVGSRLYQLVQTILRKDAATDADADASSRNEGDGLSGGIVGSGVGVQGQPAEPLPYGWYHRQTTLAGAYGSNKWDDKDEGLKEPTIRPWLGEGNLLDDDSDLSAWEGSAPMPNTAPAQPAAPSTLAPAPEAPTAQPGLPLASSVAQPLSQTAAASSELGGAELQQVEMLEGLLGTAIEKLGQEVSGLGAAVKSRDGRQVAAATNQAKVLWDGLQPALQKLRELLGTPDTGDEAVTYAQFLAEQGAGEPEPAGGGGDGDLPWGFGSRHNQVSESELQKQGKVLAQGPGQSAASAPSTAEELPFGFSNRSNQTAPDELLRQGKIVPDR